MRLHVLGAAVAVVMPTIALAQRAAPPAAQYTMMAGQSDRFEIQSGQLATRKGSPAIRKFGQQMITDHQKSTAMVMVAAKSSGLPSSPPILTPDQQRMLATLQGESGEFFDKTYVAQQLTAHRDALAVQKAYAAGGDDPNLKAAAAHIVPVVQQHLIMLEAMH